RCRNGSEDWQTGQEILKNTSSTGRLCRASRSDQPSSSTCGARLPSVSILLALHIPDERKNVESLNFAIGEETVHRVHLVVEDLEDRVELGEYQQFHIPAIQVQQFGNAARIFGPVCAHDHGP